MGAGLHEINGVNPIVSKHVYTAFVMPRITYSLDNFNIGTVNKKKLEMAHNRLLRNIQGLPTRTAVAAIHILHLIYQFRQQ